MIINKIKEFRKVKNLTQNDLAEYLGVTRKTINQIESGNVLPKIDVAYKLSIILGVTVEQLFLNDDFYSMSDEDIRMKMNMGLRIFRDLMSNTYKKLALILDLEVYEKGK